MILASGAVLALLAHTFSFLVFLVMLTRVALLPGATLPPCSNLCGTATVQLSVSHRGLPCSLF